MSTELITRPSTIRIQDLCNWYKPDGLISPYFAHGNNVDRLYPKMIAGEPPATWKLEETPDVVGAQWVADQALKLLERIECQKHLELWDIFTTPPELIMQGTCDIFGYNQEDELLEIWDIKTGRQRDDYLLQLEAYALMAFDLTDEVEARVRILYCDDRLSQETIVNRVDCESRIFGVIERLRLGVELPAENAYCTNCARQIVCEVWNQPATEGMDLMNITPTIHLEVDQTLAVGQRLEMLKSNPEQLGAFIEAWRKAEKLVEKSGIEDFAKEELLAGRKIPGWRLVEYQGRAFYNKEQIEKILAEWGESAADFLAINRERYEGACANSDNDAMQPEGHAKPFHKLLKNK